MSNRPRGPQVTLAGWKRRLAVPSIAAGLAALIISVSSCGIQSALRAGTAGSGTGRPIAQLRTFFSGQIRLEPPGALRPVKTEHQAFDTGYSRSPLQPGGHPDEVVLALFSDDEYGKLLPDTSSLDSSASTPEQRAADAAARARSGTRPPSRVKPFFERRLAWVFIFENVEVPYHGRSRTASLAPSVAAIAVDANTGEYMRAWTESK